MATALTPTLQKYLRHLPSLQRFTYDIPSVLAASTSPRYELLINGDEGIVQQLRYAYPTQTDTQAIILTADLAVRATIEEIIRTPVVDRCFQQGNLGIIFENTDPTPPSTLCVDIGLSGVNKLYLEIDNLGASATGLIQLEIIIQVSGAG